jgi:hypothetical protein
VQPAKTTLFARLILSLGPSGPTLRVVQNHSR